MMAILETLVVLLFCYIAGAIPTGLIVGRTWGGVDVREQGSKNIGATNVWRVLGWKAGLLTFALDVGKAAGALTVLNAFAPRETALLLVAGGVAVLLGNFFNVFLGGRGGKGVATSLGVFLYLAPAATLIAFAVFLVVFGAMRYVSLASILAALVLPLSVWGTGQPLAVLVFTCVASALVILRHRANIQRLLSGTEHKWGR